MGTGAREVETTDLAEAMIDAAGAAIVAVDATGLVVRWNRAAAALTGVSAAEIRGRMFSEIVVRPEHRERWKLEFDGILAGQNARLFEILWKTNEGSFAPVTCSCSPVQDREGGVRYVVCTAKHSISQAVISERLAEFHDISRYVHDTITQDLVALSFQLSMLEEAATEFPFREEVKDSVRLVERCCRHMRVIGSLLASPSLEGITLEAGIEQLAAFVGEEAGLGISLDLDPIGDAIAQEAQLLMFAAVKSWLGRSVWNRTQPRTCIRLRSPRSGGALLAMEMAPPVGAGSMQGWSAVRERAKSLGGEFSIAEDTDRIVARMSFSGPTAG